MIIFSFHLNIALLSGGKCPFLTPCVYREPELKWISQLQRQYAGVGKQKQGQQQTKQHQPGV